MKTILFFLGCIFGLGTNLSAQVEASFEMQSDPVGCDSFFVDFIDQSTSSEDLSSWLWDFGNGATSTFQNPQFSYTTSGSYNVCLTVTNVLGQTDEFCDILLVNVSNISLVDAIIINVDCNGDATGALDITIDGGVEPYSYEWTNSASTEDISGLIAGTYTVTVTDANNCSKDYTFSVTEAFPLNLDLFSICTSAGQSNGSIDLLVAGGTPPYLYNWSTGLTTEDIDDLAPGTYSVTVTDNLGCTIVEETDLLEGDLEGEIQGDFEYCIQDALSICGVVTNAQPGDIFAYSWFGPNGLASTEECLTIDSLFASLEGEYQVVITDVEGCDIVLSQEITITTEEEIIVGGSAVVPIACEDDEVQLEVITVGAPSNYTYQWTPSAALNDPTIQNPIATINSTTTYEVVVTDVSGCSASFSTQVIMDLDCVWPGDTDTNNIVNNLDLLNIGLGMDSLSLARPNASLDWVGQANYNFGLDLSGTNVNKKHIDCNGDGIINADDTLAIVQNWGLVHEFTGENRSRFW